MSESPPDRPTPEQARQLLGREREVTLRRLASLRGDFESIVAASVDTNADDEHDPEGHTIAFERSQVDALVGQAQRHLEEVDAALTRVDDGSWGTCEVCGRPIPAARLEARPTARTCVGCAGGAAGHGPASGSVRSASRRPDASSP